MITDNTQELETYRNKTFESILTSSGVAGAVGLLSTLTAGGDIDISSPIFMASIAASIPSVAVVGIAYATKLLDDFNGMMEYTLNATNSSIEYTLFR